MQIEVPTEVPKTKPPLVVKLQEIETVVGVIATGVLGGWLFLALISAGPLWRDEVNTINLAQMPLPELWQNLPFESFPPLWPLAVRGWGLLGMTDSDAGIRVISFVTGLTFLGSVWLCLRWLRARTPTLTLALLGSIPAAVFTLSSNRAYGLAMTLLVLTFGTIWRFVESPSKTTLFAAAMASILFLHCLYYDIVFFCAILFGAALVTIRRRNFKILLVLVALGAFSAASLIVYSPVMEAGDSYTRIIQVPISLSVIWIKIKDALSLRTSAQLPFSQLSWIWVWGLLTAIAVSLAVRLQSRREHQPSNLKEGGSISADLSLFSFVSLVCGSLGYFAFLLWLKFPTQAWYYMVLFTLCGISLDTILSANWPAFKPWGMVRVGFLVLVTAFAGRAMWQEAHTRRSNIDLIAAILNEKAREGDLVVVHSAFEGITFDRYYHGKAQWTTIPPLDSHKVHRCDLIWEKMNQSEVMAKVLSQATMALQKGNNVWVVGHVPLVKSGEPPAPPLLPSEQNGCYFGPYVGYWAAQLSAHLFGSAAQTHTVTTTFDRPINLFEDLPLLRFSGYKSDGPMSFSPTTSVGGQNL